MQQSEHKMLQAVRIVNVARIRAVLLAGSDVLPTPSPASD